MDKELLDVRERLKNLIIGTCNTIGCSNCPHKWGKDSDGNKCSSDYLMMLEYNLEKELYNGN